MTLIIRFLMFFSKLINRYTVVILLLLRLWPLWHGWIHVTSLDLMVFLSLFFRNALLSSLRFYPGSSESVSQNLVFLLYGNPRLLFLSKNCGDRSNPGNYRPISLLPINSKVFESLINDSLVKYLDSNRLFSDSQYSFRTGRSTIDLLTVISERVYCALNVSGQARVVARDISKAFDRV
ncbi:uncharacterized protein LOC106884129 [Octopus bimaculoides]|uniref:uncharacterized protein LOC106884129 n=1 Tax=Octopus bimaculoides TaxID=37653 RepID=UPI00071C9231|nr:uncharacterized protein LOC106884129 [Octopus bimaculoides]|eukprot:XP_014790847.1 PREDICTED: uncharacterized protein LOC106884129 [Octopus bimaculoides]